MSSLKSLSLLVFALVVCLLPSAALGQQEHNGATATKTETGSGKIFVLPSQPTGVPAPQGGTQAPVITESFVTGRVKNITAPSVNEELLRATGIVTHKEIVEVEILEGPMKGSTVCVPNEITDNPAYNIAPSKGQELVLAVVSDSKSKNPEVNIADYHRVPALAVLLAVFLAVFLFFGGKSGFKSLLGLIIGIGLIGLVLLPLSFKGFNPLLIAAGICLAITATTTTLVAGLSRKSLAATLGTVGGVIVSGFAAHLIIISAPLTGLSTEEAQILRGSVLSQPPQFYSGLLAAGMLIGALGVIMDVAVSIASAIWELSQTDRTLSRAQLYEKGMNVGRDIMGTMTNTLILAYAGSALPLLLLMAQIPSTKLLNLDLVATEIASALTGSLGLVCTIPLTALAAAHLMSSGASGNTKSDKNGSDVRETPRDRARPRTTTGERERPTLEGEERRPAIAASLSSQEAEFEKMLWSADSQAASARPRRD